MFPIFAGSNPSGYNLTRSLRFRASASAYLNRTPASASNRQIWTWSGWVKRGLLGSQQMFFSANTNAGTDVDHTDIRFSASDTILMTNDAAAVQTVNLNTTQVFRDPSAWYHIVIAIDTTQATASNRIKFYVNGAQITAFGTASYPAQNASLFINNNINHRLASYQPISNYFDGYLTEVNFIDGQALTPSSFGSTNALTGVWQPARYAGSYGTNGFYLPFTDNSALTTSSNVGLGKDFSGNANYWVTNNISITAGVTYDSMTDVPTLTSATAANYCTFNPLAYTNVFTYTNANLTASGTGAGVNVQAQGTMAISSGKFYWEITDLNGGAGSCIGISDITVSSTTSVGTSALSYGYLATSGNKINNGSSVAYGATFTANDVIGVALDLTAGTLVFYKNNTSQGTAYTGLAGTFLPAVSDSSGASTPAYTANFGQRPFTYTPPTGFVALNTYNLPTSTIVKGNTVMDATLYTGNGSTQTITNAGAFKPDLVWNKQRSAVRYHDIYDSVRGATAELSSNSTDQEQTISGVTAFNSNGFTLGSNDRSNVSAGTYVSWQWQAGQGSTSSNTNGSITSTVSVNASAGFSVVTYTGTGANATVGHGLGVAPSFIIAKNRPSSVDAWCLYHVGLTSAAFFIKLNATDAQASGASVWNSTAPTSSVFSVGSSSGSNESTKAMVAYCWTPIAGFSAFGSYTGNGSADGPFVYTGFRPKWLTVKRTDTAGTNWLLQDSVRGPYNLTENTLYPNLSDAESTGAGYFDLLSNGFKLRTSGTGLNASGGTYIYMCFAENPLKNALAR